MSVNVLLVWHLFVIFSLSDKVCFHVITFVIIFIKMFNPFVKYGVTSTRVLFFVFLFLFFFIFCQHYKLEAKIFRFLLFLTKIFLQNYQKNYSLLKMYVQNKIVNRFLIHFKHVSIYRGKQFLLHRNIFIKASNLSIFIFVLRSLVCKFHFWFAFNPHRSAC